MTKLGFFILLGALCFSSHSSAARIVNLGSDFDQFLRNTAHASQEEVEAEWERFEAKHQSIYDKHVYRKGDTDWELRLRKKRDLFFHGLPQLKDDMQTLFASAEKIVIEKEAAFRVLFSDLSPDIPVYFLPSLLSFNGKVGFLSEFGRSGLLMGVDFIVQRKDDMDVLFSHEFFHAYHGDKIVGSVGKTMATPLWQEGFATYISGVLNPDRDDDVLLMDSVLGRECKKPAFVQDLARQYLAILQTDGQTTYNDWFLLNGPTQPTRRAYCLGLHALRNLAKIYPLTEMVTWDEDRFSKETSMALQSMAQ